MASRRKKSENFNILKEIYHGEKVIKQPKKSVKEYFQDSKRIDKLLSGAVLFLGLVGIVLGFFQFRYNIKKNFLPNFNSDALEQEAREDDLLGLSQKDTDSDGLSDYDELYFYNSSPYLSDSDSDNITDWEEVLLGSDPNCPEGQNCFADWGSLTDQGSEVPMPDELYSGTAAAAAIIRQALLESGMTVEELNQVSDEDLLALYQEFLDQAESGLEPPVEQSVPVNQQIEDLTPEEIRELLFQAGASREILNTISDQELMELVEETLVE